MYKVVKKSEAVRRNISRTHNAINIITKDISPDVSIAVTEGNDFEDTATTNENRIYFILEGTLTLTFGDEKVILNKEDSCFISAGTSYSMTGSFKSITVNQPAFGIAK